ncbi:hypothetical protein Tco_0875589 [Tanacetum coccineum]|uniref:Uncharacterized protein n=1 Tax=Tanacetum coccineum TaxID=301880 RepID=A0ABQ5BQS7_9ASTR
MEVLRRKIDISFFTVFRALCYTRYDVEVLGSLRAKAMYDDYIGGQPSTDTRTAPAAPAPQVLQTPNASIITADTAPTPTNSSSKAVNNPNTSHDVDELRQQQQDDQAQLQH